MNKNLLLHRLKYTIVILFYIINVINIIFIPITLYYINEKSYIKIILFSIFICNILYNYLLHKKINRIYKKVIGRN